MNQEALIPLPEGFLCSGVGAGIKESKNLDLGLILSEKPAMALGVYTLNRFASAHVRYCRSITPTKDFRALIVNSGNANAATGALGDQNNLAMASKLAQKLGLKTEQVLTSSTGIIGHQLPIDKISSHLDPLVNKLGKDMTPFAQAILTTDLKIKVYSTQVLLNGKTYRVSGAAKGSGMIHPNMATMLSYIMTDLPLNFDDLQAWVGQLADVSFNMISVDGDCSTNDSFYLLGSNPARLDRAGEKAVYSALEQAAIDLAKQIVADGEGAEHRIQITVKGADSLETARRMVRKISVSSLVKTAVHGCDPNWGRILVALGNAMDHSDSLPEPTLSIQGIKVFVRGAPTDFDEKALSQAMEDFEVKIEVDFEKEGFEATGWGCDLSREYIAINADYHT